MDAIAGARLKAPVKGNQGLPLPTEVDRNVRYWHKADMLNALTNVAFGGKADIDQPLLTNLDL